MNIANPSLLFFQMRTGLFNGHMTQTQVDGVNALLGALGSWPMAWLAYGLATAHWETAASMTPCREQGSAAYLEKYDTGKLAEELGNTPAADGDGILFEGRGYVQLTGRANYQKAETALGLQFITDPDLALDPANAGAVMRRGMTEGWFTGKKLSDYLPAEGSAVIGRFVQARYIINGQDHAQDIADHAIIIQQGLVAASA